MMLNIEKNNFAFRKPHKPWFAKGIFWFVKEPLINSLEADLTQYAVTLAKYANDQLNQRFLIVSLKIALKNIFPWTRILSQAYLILLYIFIIIIATKIL